MTPDLQRITIREARKLAYDTKSLDETLEYVRDQEPGYIAYTLRWDGGKILVKKVTHNISITMYGY